MKDELGGKIMTVSVALRAKMYAYRKIDKEVKEKPCKGTKKCVVSEGLTFNDYKACLFDGEMIYREETLFENKKHEIYTVNKHKIALNRDDDKTCAGRWNNNIRQRICSGLITIIDAFLSWHSNVVTTLSQRPC